MRGLKLALSALFFGLAFSVPAECEVMRDTMTATYDIRFDNFQWYKRFILTLNGYDFLSWKEMRVSIISDYDTVTSSRTIIGISIIHDNRKEFFSISKDSDTYSGNVNVDMPAEFTEEAVKAYLDIWNYFFDGRTENLQIDVSPLSKQKHSNNFLRCNLKKEIKDGRTIISTIPPPRSRKHSRIETIVNNGNPPSLEMTTFELKGGETITLIRKPQ